MLAGNAHDAAGRLRDHVEGQRVLVGSAGAKALHLRVDDARVDSADHVVAEPQPLNGARREILHHDVGTLRHVLDELEPVLGLQVDGDGFLVGVEQQEIPGVLALAGGPAQREAARFAALRVFHLDDLGTEPGERLGAGRAGLELGQVQNTDAGKTAWKCTVGCHFSRPSWTLSTAATRFQTPVGDEEASSRRRVQKVQRVRLRGRISPIHDVACEPPLKYHLFPQLALAQMRHSALKAHLRVADTLLHSRCLAQLRHRKTKRKGSGGQRAKNSALQHAIGVCRSRYIGLPLLPGRTHQFFRKV